MKNPFPFPPTGPDRSERTSRRAFLTSAGAGGLVAFSAAFAGASEQAAEPTPSGRPDELFYYSATKLAEMIRKKEVSSEHIVRGCIKRIKEVNPKINAVVYLAEQQALEQAKKADQAIAQGKVDWSRQPLFGIPVSIKDNLDTIGVPSTCGALALRNNVPGEDATVVRKMKEAGAILLAKTNVPFMCSAFDTDNLVFGQTNNPYDLSRVPGGSSGGEGAILASGGSPLGIGGDSSGSIRVPSHFCGVAGLCPSWGRVSTAGVIPMGLQNNGPFFLAVGPMSRRVEDLSLALSIIAGWDYRDPFSFPLSPVERNRPKVKDLRIAYFTDTPDIHPVDLIQSTVERATQALARTGSKVVKRRPSIYDRPNANDLIIALVADDVLKGMPKLQKEYSGEKDPLILEIVDRFAALLKSLPADRLQQIERMKNEWPTVHRNLLAFMQDCDALLCPVCTHPAMKHGTTLDHAFESAFVFCEPFSLAGSLPKGVVRCGTSRDGLPIGVQVVGAPWRDDIVLEILSFLENEFGGWQAPRL